MRNEMLKRQYNDDIRKQLFRKNLKLHCIDKAAYYSKQTMPINTLKKESYHRSFFWNCLSFKFLVKIYKKIAFVHSKYHHSLLPVWLITKLFRILDHKFRSDKATDANDSFNMFAMESFFYKSS